MTPATRKFISKNNLSKNAYFRTNGTGNLYPKPIFKFIKEALHSSIGQDIQKNNYFSTMKCDRKNSVHKTKYI